VVPHAVAGPRGCWCQHGGRRPTWLQAMPDDLAPLPKADQRTEAACRSHLGYALRGRDESGASSGPCRASNLAFAAG
jgi:hypothetical protein